MSYLNFSLPLATRLANFKADKRDANYLEPWNDDGHRDDGTRLLWASSLDKLPPGIRFVGYSHELRRMDHTGWHCDPHGDGSLCRGAVFQIAGRGGQSRYLKGRVTGDDLRRGFCVESICIPITRLDEYATESGKDGRESQQVRDAAYGADRTAERYADDEREYQEKDEREQRAEEFREEAAQLRQDAVELRKGLAAKLRELCAVRECGHEHAADIVRESILADIKAIHLDEQNAEEAIEKADDIAA